MQIPLDVQLRLWQATLDEFKVAASLPTAQVVLMAKYAGPHLLPKVCTLLTTRHRSAFKKNLAYQVKAVLNGELARSNILSTKQYDCLRPCEKDTKWTGLWRACINVEKGLVH